jgi:cytochrome P450
MPSLATIPPDLAKRGAPPGPRGRWLMGNLLEFRRDVLGSLERCRDEHGPLVSVRLGNRRLVLISEPAAIEEVLVTKNHDFRKHFGVRLLEPVLGNGLLLSEGDTWLRQRRLMQPAFARRMTEAFALVVAGQTERLATAWQLDPQRDLYRDMTRLTAHVACEAFLGVDVPDEQVKLTHALECIHADYEQRFKSFVEWPLWLPMPANLRLHRAIRELDTFIGRIIAARTAGSCDGADALSLLMTARTTGTGMSDRQLRDEVMTLLLAGRDTTANTLSWCWFLLCQHPGAMHELRREVLAVCGRGLPGLKEVPDLRYARCVVHEAMRLYPPVWAFGREAVRDTSVAGYLIRRGTSVLLCQWLVHRDQRWFDRPAEFMPERWNAGDLSALPRYAYFPFGGGPRVCIGKDLALVEAVCILSSLAGRFQITLNALSKVVPWPTVTLRPRHGIRAVVEAVAFNDILPAVP